MKIKKIFGKNIISLCVLFLTLGISVLWARIGVQEIAENSCYQVLRDSTMQMSQIIYDRVKRDEEELKTIADLLAKYEEIDSVQVQDYVHEFEPMGTISALCVLTKEDEIICDEQYYDKMKAILNFSDEAAQVPYVSSVRSNVGENEEKFIFQAVSISSQEDTFGILYGIIQLDLLETKLPVTSFQNSADFYIVDAETGDFLVDTWHDTLGNVYEEKYASRQASAGYDFEKMKRDIRNGIEGQIQFVSKTAGEYLYCYYMPIGIGKWMVQLSVPESVVLADAKDIMNILNILFAMQAIIFLVYLLINLTNNRKKTKKKEEELKKTIAKLKIQQILFDAYKNPECISKALEVVAQNFEAEAAYLLLLEDEDMQVSDVCIWPDESYKNMDTLKGQSLQSVFPKMSEILLLRKNVIYNQKNNKYEFTIKEKEILERLKIEDFIFVTVQDSQGGINALLGVANTKLNYKTSEVLEDISRDFALAFKNVEAFRLVQKMGTTDALTGLKNRNSYQQFILNCADMRISSLACVYIDANGLHELNNHLGHEAGDYMLRTIGKIIFEEFKENCFRIGGDEFVVLSTNCSEEGIQNQVENVTKKVEEHGYQIAAGWAWQEGKENLNQVISAAETKMYQDKRRYYEEKKDVEKSREMNHKLEQILQEKRDADSFLSIISPYFKGVYIVDMDKDETRTIYLPSYFSAILEKTGYKFMEALRKYVEVFVSTQDKEVFLDFLNADNIKEKLKVKETIEYHYNKADGSQILLRICQSKDYSDTKKDAVWIFEEYNG